MAKRTPSQPAGGSAKARARRRDSESLGPSPRWIPEATYLIKRYGTVEAAIPHAFPGWEANKEFWSIVGKYRAATLRADYHFLQSKLGDVERWRELAEKDPEGFERALPALLNAVGLLLRLLCGQSKSALRSRGRPSKRLDRDRSVYMLYVLDLAEYDESASTDYNFATLARRYNELYEPSKLLSRHQVSNIVHRETDREIEDLAHIMTDAPPGMDPDAMPPPPLR